MNGGGGLIGPLIPPPTTGREKRKQKPRSNFKVSRVVEHHCRRRLAGKAAGQPEASQCASGSGRRPKKDLFLNAPNFPHGAAGTRWTPDADVQAEAESQADGGDDEAPPDEESDDGRLPALLPAGPLPTPLKPARDSGAQVEALWGPVWGSNSVLLSNTVTA